MRLQAADNWHGCARWWDEFYLVTHRQSWTGISGSVSFHSAQEMANDIKEAYLGETVDEVTIVYNAFKSMVAQTATATGCLSSKPRFEGGAAAVVGGWPV